MIATLTIATLTSEILPQVDSHLSKPPQIDIAILFDS